MVQPSIGLELEIPVVCNRYGHSADARPALARLLALRGAQTDTLRTSSGDLMGVYSPHGLSSFDNGYNNLETSFSPRYGEAAGLHRLAHNIERELRELNAALRATGLAAINLAEHPFSG